MIIVAMVLSIFSQASLSAEIVQNDQLNLKELDPREILKERDPFRMPDRGANRLVPKGELESFQVEELKYIGVIEGFGPTRGMLLGPNGKTYLIREKQKIGLDGGMVEKIVSEKVIILEKKINLAGEEEIFRKEILLPAENYVESKSESKPEITTITRPQQTLELVGNPPTPPIPSPFGSPSRE